MRVGFAIFVLSLCAMAHADELSERAARFDHAEGMGQLEPLLGIGALDDLTAKRDATLDFVRRAAREAQSPLVVARANWELVRLLDRRAKREEARALLRELGVVRRAIIVGPFSVELGAELPAADALPPEAALLHGAIDAATTWPSGLPAQLATVRAPTYDSYGPIPLCAWLRPDSRVGAYVVFGVETARAQDVVLHIGVSGAVKVWADGVLLGAHEGDRPLAFDADAWAVHLSVGRHRFVVRTAFSDRLPEMVARFTDDAMRPLVLAAADGFAAPTGHATKRAPGVARSGLDRDLALVLDGIDGPRPDAPCARMMSTREPRTLVAALLCAGDEDAQRRVLESRLDSGDRVALLTALGELELRSRTPARGEARLVEATNLAATDGDVWRARLRLLELEADRGLPLVALQRLSAMNLQPVRARESIAQLEQHAGHADEALALLRALSDELPGDVGLLRQVAAILRGRGKRDDLEAALRLLDGPHDPRDLESIGVERAELLEGLERSDEAARVLEQLLTLAPGDARIEERLGRLLLGGQRREEGFGHLRRALALKPQSPELRAILAELDHTQSDLRRRYAADVMAIRDRAAKDSLGKNDPSRVLYDGTTVRVHANGLQEQFVERIVEVGDRRGAEAEGTIYVRYSPDSQSVELQTARIYKASGEIVENASIDERDLSEPWAGMFYDVRAQVIRLTGVEPGDVVHVAYTLSDYGRRNELGDSFCDLHMLQESMTRLKSVYRLVAPKSRAIYFNSPAVKIPEATAKVEPTTHDEGDERVTEFVIDDVPKTVSEPGMPGETELDAYIVASTFATWTDVARFYRGLVRAQLEPDADIHRAAQAAVKGKTTVEDKVAAIYDLVVRSTRYVGLEFGVHGYQPYKVAQIWARKFGDCKDKASLLVTMLKDVGVPATMVLLRTRHEGVVDSSPPSLAIFDHAIAYVPALDRYLDGTAELSGSTELPAADQGTLGLHVNDGVLHTTPALLEAEGDDRLVVTLATDGSALVEQHRVVRGEAAEAWRRQYQPVAQRKERLEAAWSQRSAGAQVRKSDFPHLDDREKPVELDAKIALPRLARPDGDQVLAVPVLVRGPALVATLGRLSERQSDLVLSHPLAEREQIVVKLPAGAHVLVPEDAHVTSRFGHFSLHTELAADGVLVTSETAIDVRRVARADYADFRSFLIAVDRAVGSELRVELRH